MKQKVGIINLQIVKDKALPILKKHKVKKAAVFGSVARGTATYKSDVDFLIEYRGHDKTLLDLIDLKSALEKALGKKVDVIAYASINTRLRNKILSEQVSIL